ncbi:MAG: transmembrane amino acid transporter protein-domain-containing protein [Monoraphidium minutum]|nr:MAG: transmembrane amino acid transporter protein-domain-containing protein [Monoraphidium minutum]
MLGIGTLGLPADFARLGWLPALLTMALFIGGGVYSGSLYQRLAVRVPEAVVFDEIGAAAMGNFGRALVFGTVYLGILTEPCIFHYMTVESLRQMLYGYPLSTLAANAIVVILILPLAQMHHLEDVAVVGIFGTLAMLVAIAVVVGKLLVIYLAADPATAAAGGSALGAAAAGAGERPHTELIAGGSFYVAMVGVVDIAFSFGGQINWMRYITSINDRSKFSRAVLTTEAVMGSLYLLTGIVGYAALGAGMDVHRPISSVLPNDRWTVVMNAAIFVHCLIAYQVMINVWSASALHIAAPRRGAQLSEGGGGCGRRGVWFAVTCCAIAFSVFVVWLFPFFSELMAVVASFGDIASMFGLPCVFAIRLLKLRRGEALLCGALAVVAVLLSGAGLVSTAQQLAEALAGGRG